MAEKGDGGKIGQTRQFHHKVTKELPSPLWQMPPWKETSIKAGPRQILKHLLGSHTPGAPLHLHAVAPRQNQAMEERPDRQREAKVCI